MSKRTQRFDPLHKGDQFIAEMASLENPWNILLAYDAKNGLVWLTQNSRQLPHPGGKLQHLRDGFQRRINTDRAAPRVLKQPALKRPATLRPVRVDGAAFSPQRSAWLHEQSTASVILRVFDFQSHGFERGGFVAAGQFHISEQRAVATQPALCAKRVGEAWLHAGEHVVRGRSSKAPRYARRVNFPQMGAIRPENGQPCVSFSNCAAV